MNFDTKKRLFRLLLERKKGRKFFLFLSSFCENAESLGAVEKLSHRSTLRHREFFCLCGMMSNRIHFVVRRIANTTKKNEKKKRTGCGATNACVSLKKESGVIRSDIFSRESFADLSSLL